MRYTTDKYIEKAKTVHGDFFDYSKTEYNGYDIPTVFICRKHGEFKQTPHGHLYHKVCCPECVKEINDSQKSPNKKKLIKEKKDPTVEFIKKSKEIWGDDTYSYLKTKYTGSLKKVIITCPVHGDVEVLPSRHLNKDKFSGCPKCNYEENNRIQRLKKKPKKTANKTDIVEKKEQDRKRREEKFIDKANLVHNGKYGYEKVHYIDRDTNVTIICPVHGEFEQRPNDHLQGCGCQECGLKGRRQKKYSQEEYVGLVTELFGGFYSYPRTVYRGMQKPIIVTCPEHGDFEIRAFDHLHHHCGCREHHKKSTLELQIEKLLQEQEIKYIYEKRFSWLGLLSLDFYLPEYNIAIECQGEQHFIPVSIWGGEDNLKIIKKRDLLKKELCEENGVDLYYYVDSGLMKYVDEVDKSRSFSNLEKLYEKIFSKSST